MASLHPLPTLFGELINCSLFHNSHHWHFTFVISSPKSDPEHGRSLWAHRKSPWTGNVLPSQSGAPIKTEMVSQLTWNHRLSEATHPQALMLSDKLRPRGSMWSCRHRYTCVPHPEPSSLLPPHNLLLLLVHFLIPTQMSKTKSKPHWYLNNRMVH